MGLLLNGSFMSFSNDNGATTDAAGSQKSLSTCQHFAVHGWKNASEIPKLMLVIFLQKTDIKHRYNDLTLLLAANCNMPGVNFMRDL